jgi:hypothetical protein
MPHRHEETSSMPDTTRAAPVAPGPFASIAAVRRANAAHGHYFFERASMRFFNSRVLRTLRAGRFFVTAERQELDMPERFTIRLARDRGEILDVGDFQAWATAHEAAEALAGNLPLGVRIAGEAPGADPDRFEHRVLIGALPVGFPNTLTACRELAAELTGRKENTDA